MKKIIVAIVVVVGLVVAWRLISPAFISKELNEPSPLVQTEEDWLPGTGTPAGDAFETMTEAEKAEFQKAVDEMRSEVIVKNDGMPERPRIIARGTFESRAHDVEGAALLIETGDSKTLRFEDFETVNGPNLHIYLSHDLGATDFIDLGKIRATRGNVNYEIDASIDTDRYDLVLVWCVPFRVLFGYAVLN